MSNNIIIPDTLDSYIAKGIHDAKRRQKNLVRKKAAGILVVFLLTLFMGAIRVSPSFAALIKTIPGLNYLVELINHDAGLQMAVENDYIQHVGMSATYEGVTLTINDIIVDESSMLVFYTVDNASSYAKVMPSKADLTDGAGQSLQRGISLSLGNSGDKKYSEKMQLFFPSDDHSDDFSIPDKVTLSVNMVAFASPASKEHVQVGSEDFLDNTNREIELSSTWSFDITIDKSIFMRAEKTYPVNQKIAVGGQVISVESLTLLPTRATLDISFDANNTMKIFSLENLFLVDETGRQWGRIMNGITASSPDENRVQLYFQSNYFTTPKTLTLTGSGIRAINKELAFVQIDPVKKALVETPDENLILNKLEASNNTLHLKFSLQKPEIYTDLHFGILSNLGYDQNGNTLEEKQSGTGSTDNTNIQSLDYWYSYKGELEGLLQFTVNDYPSYIDGPFSIAILP